jgi:hypothetical protein
MMYISFSESNRPEIAVIMINKKSFILKIDEDGLRKTDTVCPQDDIDYDLIRNNHYVKVVGVDLI